MADRNLSPLVYARIAAFAGRKIIAAAFFLEMIPPRYRALLLVVFLASTTYAAPRHRAVAPPPPEPAADWLAKHAIPLATTEATGNVDDAPLASIVGGAHVVGLGDATHGTHQFFTVKLRMIQFLVERMGF